MRCLWRCVWELPSEVRLLRIPADLPWGVSKVENGIALKTGAVLLRIEPPLVSTGFSGSPSFKGEPSNCSHGERLFNLCADCVPRFRPGDPVPSAPLHSCYFLTTDQTTRPVILDQEPFTLLAICTRSYVQSCPQAAHPRSAPRQVVPALMAAK